MPGLVPKALWVLWLQPCVSPITQVLLEAEHAGGTENLFCWPGSCPDHLSRLLWPHPQVSPVVDGVPRAVGRSPLIHSLPWPGLWGASSLSRCFPCTFPSLGSCCSFCLESFCSLFCLVKSLFSSLALMSSWPPWPPLSELIAPSFVLLNSTYHGEL